MLHVRGCAENDTRFCERRSFAACWTFKVAGVGSAVEWYWRGSKVLVGLYTENNVLVRTAARLLAEQQPAGQARWLAHHGHVVSSPRLAVFVHHSRPCAGGPVPKALLGPEEETEKVKLGTRHKNKAKV